MITLPGDQVSIPSTSNYDKNKGISRVNDKLHAYSLGILSNTNDKMNDSGMEIDSNINKKSNKNDKWFIKSNSRRYLPTTGDSIIGIITNRGSENYRVDIGSSSTATLDALAFEGATKRTKPNLKVGCLIYARISLAHRDMETELECLNPTTGKSEGFGELKSGIMIDNLSLNLCRSLLTPNSDILVSLMNNFTFPFELATGLNGRIWINATTISQTIFVKRTIEKLDEEGIQSLTPEWFNEFDE